MTDRTDLSRPVICITTELVNAYPSALTGSRAERAPTVEMLGITKVRFWRILPVAIVSFTS
jgi:hypothetical protein